VIARLLGAVGLAAIYLLVLTSLAPGDLLVGGLLGLAIVIASGSGSHRRSVNEWRQWTVAFVRMVLETGLEIAVGTVRVARFCLTGHGSPGFVEIPRGDRSRHGVALWGVLTGEAPDEYPVAVDDARHVLIVHNVDASHPDAIRARHAGAHERHQRHVVR
jgi:multisubunit Na+/H+ antiporter MnhE subunit